MPACRLDSEDVLIIWKAPTKSLWDNLLHELLEVQLSLSPYFKSGFISIQFINQQLIQLLNIAKFPYRLVSRNKCSEHIHSLFFSPHRHIENIVLDISPYVNYKFMCLFLSFPNSCCASPTENYYPFGHFSYVPMWLKPRLALLKILYLF